MGRRRKEYLAQKAAWVETKNCLLAKGVRCPSWFVDVQAYKFESKIAGQVFQTEDAKEGPKAFAEKRPPVWKSK